jgi:hypothetical protein
MNKPIVEDRVLDKIRKCLALSKSSNEHEAAAALRQAQKLMELHNVSEVGLVADIGENRFKSKTSISRPKFWESSLVKLVASAFGCKMYWQPHRTYEGPKNYFGEYTLVGPKTQLELAVYTCEVMQRKLVAARTGYLKTLGKNLDRMQLTQHGDGFAKGWVETVASTIHAFATPEPVKAAINLWIADKCCGKRTGNQTRGVRNEGVEAGRAAGKGASIHRPMHGREQLKIGG